MRVRLNERILARQLREQGLSFSEIMQRIPNLSKGTLNGWLKGIELSEEQKKRLFAKMEKGADKGRLKGAFRNHQKRIETTYQIINDAKEEARKRGQNSFFTMGIMLYWAEGDKSQERVGFTNADPAMIHFIMKWFREVCGTSEERFRVALSIMTLHDKNASERFWSEITGIPLGRFNKTRIKQTPLKGKRNPSYMGTCRIIISDKNLFRKIMGWRLGILENLKIFAPVAQRIEQVNSNH